MTAKLTSPLHPDGTEPAELPAPTTLTQLAVQAGQHLTARALTTVTGADAGAILTEWAPDLAGKTPKEHAAQRRALMGLLRTATALVALARYLPGDEVRIDPRFDGACPPGAHPDTHWIVEDVEDDHARIRQVEHPELPAATVPLGALVLVERPIPDDVDEPTSGDVADILGALIAAFDLDDPGAHINRHVASEADRLRWRAALRQVQARTVPARTDTGDENHAVPVTVEVVLIGERARCTYVLMTRRRGGPFDGWRALPGGPVPLGQTVAVTAVNTLAEQTGIAAGLLEMEHVGIYDTPGRDPNGPALSIARAMRVRRLPQPRPGGNAVAVGWVSVDELLGSKIAFDHERIIRDALAMEW